MPQDRSDFLLGQVCAVLANIHRTKDASVFKPGDFLPKMRDDADDESTDESAADVDPLAQIQATSAAIKSLLGKKD